MTPKWGQDGQDEAKRGQDEAKMGPMLAVILLMLCETCFFKNGSFASARAPFWGVRRAEIRSRWSYVETKLAYVGLSLDLYWLKLATAGRKVAYVGPC